MSNYDENLLDGDKVAVMNEVTWEEMRTEMLEKAGTMNDPIRYLTMLQDITIVIDNRVEVGLIEIYDKDIYDSIVSEENNKGEE